MDVELTRHPRFKGADDENCIWYLIVNGYNIGKYYCGKDKFYEDKYKWADKMIKKRVPVILRNIERLNSELSKWDEELKALTNN